MGLVSPNQLCLLQLVTVLHSFPCLAVEKRWKRKNLGVIFIFYNQVSGPAYTHFAGWTGQRVDSTFRTSDIRENQFLPTIVVDREIDCAPKLIILSSIQMGFCFLVFLVVPLPFSWLFKFFFYN